MHPGLDSGIRKISDFLGRTKCVFVAGLRGIPNIQGGVETHCQRLYPRIAKAGTSVKLFARSSYVSGKSYEFDGVQVLPLAAPRSSKLEAIVHTGLAILRAKGLAP